MRLKYFAIMLLFLSTLSVAAIYVETGKNGETIYSDTPSGNAKSIVVPSDKPVSTLKIPAVTKPVVQSASSAEAKPSYTTFVIASPKDQETIQNQPSFPVELTVAPTLQTGDKIQLFLDGKLSQTAASTRFELAQVERGTHQIYATIVDSSGSTIKQTNTITVYVHQASTSTISKAAGH